MSRVLHCARAAIRRPLGVVAVVLIVTMLLGGVVVGRHARGVVIGAAREDAERLATEAVRARAADAADRTAGSVAVTLRPAETAAGLVARTLTWQGPEPLLRGTGADADVAFQLLEDAGKALHWATLEGNGVLAVVPGRYAAPETLEALGRRAAALSDLATLLTRGDGAVSRITVWVEGEGLITAPGLPVEALAGLARAGSAPGTTVLGLDRADTAAWSALRATLPGPESVSYAIPVVDGSGERFAVVSAELPVAALAAVAGEGGPPHPTARPLLVAGVAEVLTAAPGTAELLGLPAGSEADLVAVTEALRLLRAGAARPGPDDQKLGEVFGTATVPGTDWTVATVSPPGLVQESALAGPVSTRGAGRYLETLPLLFAVVLGLLTAAALFVLAASFRRRLGAVRAGVDALAAGDLDHRVSDPGADEIAALAESLNHAATRMRGNMRRLEESKRRLSGLIQHMGNGLVVTDAADRITFTNPRFEELVQRTSEDLIGRRVEELILPESIELYRTEVARRLEGQSGQYELLWRVPGPRRPRTIVSGMPLFDGDGHFCGSFGVVTDITAREQVRAETARSRKLRALGAMAGGVAHDFNHVLTIILGNAQFLLQDKLPDDVRESLESIEQAAMDGSERVRRVREFTKLRSAVQGGEVLDPNELVRDVLELAAERIKHEESERGVTYEITRRPLARRNVRGNSSELREALLNIVVNALEAMPEGGSLTVEAFDRGEDAIGMRIEDTGVGMDPEVQDKVFDPFFSTKEDGSSSGLGLSIAFGIMRAHGGRIVVRSRSGEGTALTAVLPAHRVSEEVWTKDTSPAAPRVLYAASRVEESEPLQKELQDLGLYVALVKAYAAAESILTDAAIFNTLVVEHDFGGHSGWELARVARRARPELRILLLTDPSLAADKTQARNAGIDCVLVRPFDARDVHAEILAAAVRAPARAGQSERNPKVPEPAQQDKRTLTATGPIATGLGGTGPVKSIGARPVTMEPRLATGPVYAEPDEADSPG